MRTKIRDKVHGALLGVAVGDALGAPLEFMTVAEIIDKHGGPVRDMIGGGWLNIAPGEITDDTQMTLAVAEGIVENPRNPTPGIGQRFIEWHDSNPKDIGNCCKAAILSAKMAGARSYEQWYAVAQLVDEMTGGQTAGNGALMRTVYPAIYYDYVTDAAEASCRISDMTHYSRHSRQAVKDYACAIAAAILYENDAESKRWANHFIERIECFLNGRPAEPTGYCIDTIVCAHNSIMDTESFEDAVISAVNLGGDADTIGAVTGGLAGAIYGAAAIPTRWIAALDSSIVAQISRLTDAAMKANTRPLFLNKDLEGDISIWQKLSEKIRNTLKRSTAIF